jgi:phosphohistidine swiveling domain-containing protein
MRYISSQNDLDEISLVGGKGHHLQKLISWGAPVAPFIVFTTKCFEDYQATKNIPNEVDDEILTFFKKYPIVALRSSMIGEDHKEASFAGLFETILNVTIDNWKQSLLKIYESVHSDRVQEYLKQKKLDLSLSMAVVCQAQIQVEKSGVLFTRSPVFPTSAMAIDAAFGMGEGVVSGLVNVDTYKLTRTGEVFFVNQTNPQRVLENKEIEELRILSLQLEKKQESPSDIEWGIFENKLYIFQIRPITMDFSPLRVLVDTNLSESYPGVVSPLTSGFVKLAYRNVFRESAVLLGASGRRLSQLTFHYTHLIENVDNHLYYNLEHYYAVLRALPGGEKNIENWHKMIGGKIEGATIPYHETRLSWPEAVKTVLNLGSLFVRRKKIFNSFIKDLSEKKNVIEKDLQNLRNSKEVTQYLNNLLQRPLGFGLTVINDIFIMIGLGLLSSILKKKGIEEEKIIEILKTSEGVDSIKPLEALNDLLSHLSHEFLKSYETLDLSQGLNPYQNLGESLKKMGFSKEVDLLLSFLKDYGDRSFEELKLESLPLKNNPRLLIDLIKWAKDLHSNIAHQKNISTDFSFSWWEEKVISFTRESIAVREATRLWRGRFYNLFRQLVLKLREELIREYDSMKSLSTSDIFSLSSEEWLKFSEGKIEKETVLDLIQTRKKWQSKIKNFPEIIEWSLDEELFEVSTDNDKGSDLAGQGVSPGEVEGIALVLESPTEALNVHRNDFILVTKNTDPAWVYIMSRSRGLISEKGSLLSHTAIIGRELGIPTVVGVKGATTRIKTGDKLRLDSKLGLIKKL